MTKIVFVVVLIIEVFLSHQPGEESGAESRALAKSLHIPEKWLRIGAHIILFSILSFLMITAFPELPLWLRIGAVGAWCYCDELSKIPVPGRHYSFQDFLWNVCGLLIGIGIWMITTLVK